MTIGTDVKHGLSSSTLRMQENIVPRATFVPKRMEVTRDS